MSDQDFIDILNFARSRGAVARMLHPLVLVVTTAEYATTAPGIAEVRTEQALNLEAEGGGTVGQ